MVHSRLKKSKVAAKPRAAKKRAPRRQKAIPPPIAEASYPYDVTFEILLRLTLAAVAGQDIGLLLIRTVSANFPGLRQMPEFLCAMDVIRRPADAVVPWLLTVNERDVQPAEGE
jgi:hypothetical protein